MPTPLDELKKANVAKRTGSRIGRDDILLQEIVKIVNESPKYTTLTGIAQTLHLRGKFLNVKESNLRSQIRRRLDILENMKNPDGKPALMRRSELRTDAYGSTDGTIRYVWFLPEYEHEVLDEKVTIDDLLFLIDFHDYDKWIKDVFSEWHEDIPKDKAFDAEGWKIHLWEWIREKNKDLIWSQLVASYLGVEQDAVMQKRVLRALSPIIDDMFEV